VSSPSQSGGIERYFSAFWMAGHVQRGCLQSQQEGLGMYVRISSNLILTTNTTVFSISSIPMWMPGSKMRMVLDIGNCGSARSSGFPDFTSSAFNLLK
jgi:hypothetical protein